MEEIVAQENKIVEETQYKSFVFEGTGKEYFRIWIVNIALTILTLGIYSAWAKVRSNRYMYANTYLNGSNFEYNADPIRILIGRIIVVGFYVLFVVFSQYLFMFEVAAGIAIMAFLAMPWLVRQAVSFKLRNTSYRNVPFRYTGRTRDFYVFFLLHGLLNIFTFFLAFPFSYVRFKELVLHHAHYGHGTFSFRGKVQNVYEIYFSIIGWTMLFLIAMALIIAVLGGIYGSSFGAEEMIMLSGGGLEEEGAQLGVGSIMTGMVTFVMLLIYLPIIFGQKGLSDAYFSNYVRNHTKLEEAPLKGEMNPFKLAWISITNALAIIFTLGLLYPWSKIRYLKYKLEHTSFACTDYDQFESHGYEKGSTVGEEMMDFFDLGIGL
ncbi:DUF898 domain-containing protein [bacterium]|nr:DUF898 domain-containing protein [bacterium]MBU1958372.1 DUF898 domain-containing protein [bacterium]